MNDKPLWSRCSLGRNRWYWLVYQSWESMYHEEDPIASGYAISQKECEAAALAVEPTAIAFNANLAASHHRKLCVQRRMRKVGNSRDAALQEYLYRDHDRGDWWNGAGDWLYSEPYRIVKKTNRSVFVEKRQWRPQNTWRAYDIESYRLNREQLEQTGEVWSRQAGDYFYTKPREERRQHKRPQYLEELNLPVEASSAEIRAQYRRLAKVHHPDCGGNPEDFIRITNAYEQAIQYVRT